jgi:hypothetical protein
VPRPYVRTALLSAVHSVTPGTLEVGEPFLIEGSQGSHLCLANLESALHAPSRLRVASAGVLRALDDRRVLAIWSAAAGW